MKRFAGILIGGFCAATLSACGSAYPGEYFYAHVPLGADFARHCGRDAQWCEEELRNMVELDDCTPAIPAGIKLGPLVTGYIAGHYGLTFDRPYTEAARLALYARWPCPGVR